MSDNNNTPTPKEWEEFKRQVRFECVGFDGKMLAVPDYYVFGRVETYVNERLSHQKQELVEERKDEQYRIWVELFLLLQKDLEPKLLDKVRKIVFNLLQNK